MFRLPELAGVADVAQRIWTSEILAHLPVPVGHVGLVPVGNEDPEDVRIGLVQRAGLAAVFQPGRRLGEPVRDLVRHDITGEGVGAQDAVDQPLPVHHLGADPRRVAPDLVGRVVLERVGAVDAGDERATPVVESVAQQHGLQVVGDLGRVRVGADRRLVPRRRRAGDEVAGQQVVVQPHVAETRSRACVRCGRRRTGAAARSRPVHTLMDVVAAEAVDRRRLGRVQATDWVRAGGPPACRRARRSRSRTGRARSPSAPPRRRVARPGRCRPGASAARSGGCRSEVQVRGRLGRGGGLPDHGEGLGRRHRPHRADTFGRTTAVLMARRELSESSSL